MGWWWWRGNNDGAKLFPVVGNDRERDNKYKKKHQNALSNIGKHILMVRVIKHQHRLLKEVRDSSPLTIFKRHLDVVPGNWVQVAVLEQGFGLNNLQRSIPTSTVLWFWDMSSFVDLLSKNGSVLLWSNSTWQVQKNCSVLQSCNLFPSFRTKLECTSYILRDTYHFQMFSVHTYCIDINRMSSRKLSIMNKG